MARRRTGSDDPRSAGRAVDNLGPHLLGRVFVPDARDWTLPQLLEKAASFRPTETLQNLADDPRFSLASLPLLWRYVMGLRHPGPSPTPQPPPSPVPPSPPAPGPVGGIWPNAEPVLDQGQTPHCVGFGWCKWGNTMPVDDAFANADGHAVYYEAKVIDGQPRQENGSSVRSGAEAMKKRGRLAAYAFASSLSDIDFWLAKSGSVVAGTNWTQGMFSPDANGLIRPTGSVEGGHCYDIDGQAAVGSVACYTGENSWGNGWAIRGRFYIAKSDFAALLSEDGEACLALELPRSAGLPVPESLRRAA